MTVAAARRRLGCLTRHLDRSESQVSAAPTAASTQEHARATAPVTALDSVQKQHLREFVSRGVTIVGPEQHGLPAEIHTQVWDNLKAGKAGDGIGTRMPEMVKVLNSPGMVRALNAIMGQDWAIVPFIHSGFGGAGRNDQTWYAMRRATSAMPPSARYLAD